MMQLNNFPLNKLKLNNVLLITVNQSVCGFLNCIPLMVQYDIQLENKQTSMP